MLWARFYFFCASLAADDWDTIAVAVASALLVVVLIIRFTVTLDSASILPFPLAYTTAVAAYAGAVVLGVLGLALLISVASS